MSNCWRKGLGLRCCSKVPTVCESTATQVACSRFADFASWQPSCVLLTVRYGRRQEVQSERIVAIVGDWVFPWT